VSKFNSILAAAKNNPSEVEPVETEISEAAKLEVETIQTSKQTEKAIPAKLKVKPEAKLSKAKSPKVKPKTNLPEKPIENPIQPETLTAVENKDSEPKKTGRPKGKRSDPNFEQVTAYIQSITYTSVKIELLKEGQKREFSELVQELLEDWLRERS
jgi:hypothetical protein